MSEQKYAFPTEVLALPSRGLLYPKDHPLSTGQIDVKYMTAKEEDILTSSNLIEKGMVIDRLLESVIADPKIKLDDILIGDKNALMVGTRVLGYGKDYVVTMEDPDTSLEVEHTFDLTKLVTKKVDEKLFEDGKNEFEFTLPNSKRVITFKLLTHKDEREIDSTIKALEKLTKLTGVSNELTTRLKQQVVSIDGETDRKVVDDFVDNQFLAMDSKAFRNYYDKISPDVIFEADYESQIGEPHKVDIPIGVRFFWPDARI